MPDFSKTSKPRDFGSLIPANTVAPMVARIKHGDHGEGGLLTSTETDLGGSANLHLELTITAGEHKGRKLWIRPTVEGDNHAKAIEIAFDLLGSILRSAYNVRANDESPELDVSYHAFDGLHFIGKVGVERGKQVAGAAPGEKWPDKNTLLAGVTRDEEKEWKPWTAT